MVRQDAKNLGRTLKAEIEISWFEELFKERSDGKKLKLKKELEDMFVKSGNSSFLAIENVIKEFRSVEIARLSTEVEKQKTRLANAEAKLKIKETKAALNDQRIATDKIKQYSSSIMNLSSPPSDKQLRIYPNEYAPVVIVKNNKRIVVPLRYGCRPFGMPDNFDLKYPGCYNARYDNLDKFWKKQFEKQRGVVLLSAFFENVKKHDYEKRSLKKDEPEENMILKFQPEGIEQMIVPVIWDEWVSGDGEVLRSFAIITDEPPREISETGHDRCPVFLKSENVDLWLNENTDQKSLFQILDDKFVPYYKHQIAA